MESAFMDGVNVLPDSWALIVTRSLPPLGYTPTARTTAPDTESVESMAAEASSASVLLDGAVLTVLSKVSAHTTATCTASVRMVYVSVLTALLVRIVPSPSSQMLLLEMTASTSVLVVESVVTARACAQPASKMRTALNIANATPTALAMVSARAVSVSVLLVSRVILALSKFLLSNHAQMTASETGSALMELVSVTLATSETIAPKSWVMPVEMTLAALETVAVKMAVASATLVSPVHRVSQSRNVTVTALITESANGVRVTAISIGRRRIVPRRMVKPRDRTQECPQPTVSSFPWGQFRWEWSLE